MEVKIRKEQEGDFKDVYHLNKKAFGHDAEPELVEKLRKSIDFIPELSLVATSYNNIFGHILFTKVKIVDERGTKHDSLALAPMAVMPEVQKKGIGAQLIRYGLNRAKELGYKSVIVLGCEKYYPKFGFSPAEKWNIKSPFKVPADIFMAVELVEEGLEGVTGTVEYPEEFDMVESLIYS